MSAIRQTLDSLTTDRRASYLFDTKVIATALDVHPNRVSDWWYRTKEKLRKVAKVQPGQLAAEMAVIFAEAEMDRQAEAEAQNPAA